MVQRVSTVAFEGIEVRPVDVQVQVAPGLPAFTIVGNIIFVINRRRERRPSPRLFLHPNVHRHSVERS